jgi:hypothetical protein
MPPETTDNEDLPVHSIMIAQMDGWKVETLVGIPLVRMEQRLRQTHLRILCAASPPRAMVNGSTGAP